MTAHEQDTPERARVLIVEDDQLLADLYATWLTDRYDPAVAYSGREALTILENSQYEVVLLDRWLPYLSGEDVLADIRDRELDCMVAMVTAVQPDLDIIDLAFDSYVHKPVARAELLELVERLLTLADQPPPIQRLYALAEKRVALTAAKRKTELATTEAFANLEATIATLKATHDARVADLEGHALPPLNEGLSPRAFERTTR